MGVTSLFDKFWHRFDCGSSEVAEFEDKCGAMETLKICLEIAGFRELLQSVLTFCRNKHTQQYVRRDKDGDDARGK